MKYDLAAAAIIVLAIFIVAGVFLLRPAFENPALVVDEAPLYKNSYLKLSPGEAYVYTLDMNGSSAKATYLVGEGENCTFIRMMEAANHTGACLDRLGMDKRGFNSSLEEPSILMFQPWMLALKEGWRWNSTTYFSFQGKLKRIGYNSYRVIRMENYTDRSAFVVELISDDGPPEYEWIDAEKRILLRMSGDGYEIKLAGNSTVQDLMNNS
jgi:hypothetical protein